MSMAAAAPGGSGGGNGGGDKKWKVPESRPDLFEDDMEEDDEEEKQLPNLNPLKEALPTKKEMEQKGRGKKWLKVNKSGGKSSRSFIKKRNLNPPKLIVPNIRIKESPAVPPPPSDGDDDDDDDDDDSKGSHSKKPNK